MKGTVHIDDSLLVELAKVAALQGRTPEALIDTAIRAFLGLETAAREIPALPSFKSGGALVDIADRGTVFEAMESAGPNEAKNLDRVGRH